MDCEPEEIQFLGMFGIYQEAAKILVCWRRLFAQIGSALVLPLSFLFFAYIVISHRLASDWSSFLLFKGGYLLALLVLALLSTAAVVYSVASIYTAHRDLTFRKVIAVAPRVWRRLMSTFICAFLILFALHSLAIALFLAIMLSNIDRSDVVPLVVWLTPLYVASLIYISVVWHLASVLSVLEDARGLEAMRRSRRLIEGKLLLACVIFLKLNFFFGLVEWGFWLLLAEWSSNGAGLSLLLSLVLLLLLGLMILFALTVQTVVYFVCKSYHHESIDKTNLADHLEAYIGEYVPLKSQDVQMEQQLRV